MEIIESFLRCSIIAKLCLNTLPSLSSILLAKIDIIITFAAEEPEALATKNVEYDLEDSPDDVKDHVRVESNDHDWNENQRK